MITKLNELQVGDIFRLKPRGVLRYIAELHPCIFSSDERGALLLTISQNGQCRDMYTYQKEAIEVVYGPRPGDVVNGNVLIRCVTRPWGWGQAERWEVNTPDGITMDVRVKRRWDRVRDEAAEAAKDGE